MMSKNQIIEVKAVALLTFMGLGATLAGAGCLAGAIRSIFSLAKGEIE